MCQFNLNLDQLPADRLKKSSEFRYIMLHLYSSVIEISRIDQGYKGIRFQLRLWHTSGRPIFKIPADLNQ